MGKVLKEVKSENRALKKAAKDSKSSVRDAKADLREAKDAASLIFKSKDEKEAINDAKKALADEKKKQAKIKNTQAKGKTLEQKVKSEGGFFRSDKKLEDSTIAKAQSFLNQSSKQTGNEVADLDELTGKEKHKSIVERAMNAVPSSEELSAKATQAFADVFGLG